MRIIMNLFSLILLIQFSAAEDRPRARNLGVPFDGKPGEYNAITDVAGVKVGHSTIIKGDGKLKVGRGPIRTGVTAVLPRGDDSHADPVFAGWYALNGNGEMTGTTWVEESGFLEGPVMITNTHSVGVVRDAVISWRVERGGADASGYWWSLPVVAETYDGFLNDINGFHVKESHAHEALKNASVGPVIEGSVGGGTGMVCHGFKGGIGTASRLIKTGGKSFTVGVLVQANYGARRDLMVAGVPVGKEIPNLLRVQGQGFPDGDGSIIVIVATDAPLLAHQCKRIARRIPLGIARVGTVAHNGSGDIFIAFSTANSGMAYGDELSEVSMLPNGVMNPLFKATVHATEEAIINALVAAEDMTGVNGNRVYALPHQQLKAILKKYNRLEE
ncbi:MAG: P1 family peptidase [Candidatus Neomarinimicrobiota bacterium]|nr:P1 family peptidase [Candidatus Neomarinimicrobiota bacterium]